MQYIGIQGYGTCLDIIYLLKQSIELSIGSLITKNDIGELRNYDRLFEFVKKSPNKFVLKSGIG